MVKYSFLKLFKKESAYENAIAFDNTNSSFFDNHPDTVMQLDLLGRIINVNDAGVKMFGYNKREILIDRAEVIRDIVQNKRKEYFKKAIEGITQSFQEVTQDKYGKVFHVETTYMPMLSENMEVETIFVIIKDITMYMQYKQEAITIQDKLKYIETYDLLTELPNRLACEEEVERLIQSKQKFSILILELNRLSLINDSLGKKVGDNYIKEFSNKINSVLNGEGYIARFSGDKFAILIRHYGDSRYPEKIANNIIKVFKAPILLDELELYVTINIGISHFNVNGVTKEELIRNAKRAFYFAKELGQNSYYVYDSIHKAYTNQINLEKDLRKSIINKELMVYFQPRVDASNGKIVSAEALVRWSHPERGLISPDEFIPLAEEIGFINEIGDWVVERVCQYLHDWKQDGLEIVPISVNVSAQRFMKMDWKESFLNPLSKYSIEPELIEIEITETTLIKHEEIIRVALEYLSEIGFKIAIDDFGTGYSSLTYINKFPINTIKVDRSFINQVVDSEDVAVIIKSLIFMAKGLKMNLVAEGVETFEQLSFLKQQECQEIQGYIFSQPVSSEEWIGLLRRERLKPSTQSSGGRGEDRRNYFRINLSFPLRSRMFITSIGGKKVELGNTEVLIEDIGPGGLRFLSSLNLPVRPDIICGFEVIIMGNLYTFKGIISWKEDVKGIHQYGIEFIMEEVERDKIIGVLNQFLLQLRKNPFVQQCEFVEEDRFSYMKRLLHGNGITK